MIAKKLRGAIRTHAVECYPQECCGVVIDGKYIPCTNTSVDPLNAFAMSPETLMQEGIQAIVHSHPNGTAKPSQADLVMCEESAIDRWIICSVGAQEDGSIDVEEWNEFRPSGYYAPLVGCEFSHGVNDCYGLIRRWYRQERNICLPDFPRAGEWWNDGKSDLYSQYPKAGFVKRDRVEDMQTGDVLLMHIRSHNNVPNHAAVYLGNDTILHHLYGQLSRRDSLPRYLPYVVASLEYKGDTLSRTLNR